MKITLYDFPAKTNIEGWESYSPFVLQVARALCFAELEFEHAFANMIRLKELNPLGQLPVVAFGDEKIADSTRIMKRIEELVPGVFTRGLDARAKAEAWLWEDYADKALYPFVLATRWADDRGWPAPRDAFFGGLPPVVRTLVARYARSGTMKMLVARDFTRGGLDACYERMAAVLDELEARAPREGFWLCDAVTAADLGLFAQLHSLRMPVVEHAATEVAKRETLSRYLDRVDVVTRKA